jgi:hypothetical protein
MAGWAAHSSHPDELIGVDLPGFASVRRLTRFIANRKQLCLRKSIRSELFTDISVGHGNVTRLAIRDCRRQSHVPGRGNVWINNRCLSGSSNPKSVTVTGRCPDVDGGDPDDGGAIINPAGQHRGGRLDAEALALLGFSPEPIDGREHRPQIAIAKRVMSLVGGNQSGNVMPCPTCRSFDALRLP